MLRSPNFFIWRRGVVMPEQFGLQAGFGAAPAPEEVDPAAALDQALAIPATAVRALFGLLAVLAIAFYWALDGTRIARSLLLAVPQERREQAREFVELAEARLGAFVAGQALLCLLIGGLMLAVYVVVGLPYALALAVFAGLMEAVPLIGPALGAIPAIIVAYSVDPSKALWVLLATAVIQQVESQVLVPRVMKRSVGVHPLVTLLALSGLGALFGLPGMLVAIPVAGIAQMVINRHLLSPEARSQDPTAGERDRLAVLRYELRELIQDVRKVVRTKEAAALPEDDHFEDSLEIIAADLDSLLAQVAANRGEA
jgi:predicted PurR-regulated permease PerM